jgi:hypothetical protein
MTCNCGCGKETRGMNQYVHGHNRRGKTRCFSASSIQRMCLGQKKRFENPENHPRWKGGEMLAKGYLWIRLPGHHRANRQNYVKNCILIVEDWLRIPIMSNYDIHHINGDKLDDRPINLAVLTHAEHARIHTTERHRNGGL